MVGGGLASPQENMWCVNVWECAHECVCLQSWKSDHLELEGQAIVSCPTWVLGSKLGSFAKAT